MLVLHCSLFKFSKRENAPRRHGGHGEAVGLSGDRDLTERVIGLAIDVHRHLGPGLLESAYQECLNRELTLRGIKSVSAIGPIHAHGIRRLIL